MITELAAEVAASSWEIMARRCAEHAAAVKELEAAELEEFLCNSLTSGVRLLCAEISLQRAEGRLR